MPVDAFYNVSVDRLASVPDDRLRVYLNWLEVLVTEPIKNQTLAPKGAQAEELSGSSA